MWGKVTLSETAPTANFTWGHTDRLVGTHRQTRGHTGVHTKARGQLVGISSLLPPHGLEDTQPVFTRGVSLSQKLTFNI